MSINPAVLIKIITLLKKSFALKYCFEKLMNQYSDHLRRSKGLWLSLRRSGWSTSSTFATASSARRSSAATTFLRKPPKTAPTPWDRCSRGSAASFTPPLSSATHFRRSASFASRQILLFTLFLQVFRKVRDFSPFCYIKLSFASRLSSY